MKKLHLVILAVLFGTAFSFAQSSGGSGGGGSGTGGPTTFDQVGSGTNANSLTVGTGGSLSASGTGSINASSAPQNVLTGDVTTPGSGSTVTSLAALQGNALTIASLAQNQVVCSDTTTSFKNCYLGMPVNAQIGTTYPLVAGDRNTYLTFNNGSATAVTVPQANTAGFTANYGFHTKNLGAGIVTYTPTTSTVDGGANKAVNQGDGCDWFSDNTNYFTACFSGPITAGTGITVTRSAAGPTVAFSNTVGTGGTGLTSGTSGGVLGFTGSTTLASSVALTNNVAILGGGAGATPKNSLLTDNGTTATYTGTGGYSAPQLVSTGANAGAVVMTQGAAQGHATANTITDEAPAAVTAYEVVWPGTAASGIPTWSNASNVVTESITAITGSGNVVEATSPTLTTPNVTVIKDGNANPFLTSSATASAVDSVTITNAATATPATVTIAASGSDADINLALGAKGTNLVQVNSLENNTTNSVFVSADFTTAANTSLQAITGLTWTFPKNKAVNSSFHCALLYSQATAAAAVAFGIGAVTVTPTQINASGTNYTNTTAETTGTLTALASTTATAIVSATPSAITTIWKAELDGTIEEPSNASNPVVNIYVSTATSGDAVTVKRGSYCRVF